MSGSRRAHTSATPNPDTSTGTDHACGQSAHPHPQANAGPLYPGPCPLPPNHGHTASIKMKPPDQIPQRPTKRTCPHKDPRGWSTPTAPGQSSCLPGSPQVRVPHPAEPRASRAAAADALGPGKAGGPRPAPPLRPARLARRMERRGWVGASGPARSANSRSARRPAPPGKPAAAASARSPRRPGRGPPAGAFPESGAARPPAPARRRALPRPPGAQQAPAGRPRLRERR